MSKITVFGAERAWNVYEGGLTVSRHSRKAEATKSANKLRKERAAQKERQRGAFRPS